jgi:transmembrane sensor
VGFKQLDVQAIDSRARMILDDSVPFVTRRNVSRVIYSAGSLRGWVRYSIAATAAVLISGFGIKYISNAQAPQLVRTYTTVRAQRANVMLPDGSQAVLAPDTKLHYVANGNSRTVELTGQAYFTVEHAPHKSFIVSASGVTTRVLGTSFSVRAYPTDEVAQVAVAEGKVAIGINTILLAGDVGSVAQGRQPVVTHDAKLVDVFGWTRGHLSFDGVPFRDVAYELERAYDLNIKLTSVLSRQLITLKLENRSASDMLEALSIAVDAKVERNGKNVVFSQREQ